MRNIKIAKETWYNVLFFTFIFSLVLLPPFQLPWFQFKFQVVDFFMPLLIGVIYINKWYKNQLLLSVKNLFFLAAIVVISILANREYCGINDYFEIYRIFTYLLVFIVFKEIYNPKFAPLVIDIVFVLLLIFNFFHYHNLFNFNAIVMPLYCGEDSPHLFFFGLNSLLEPATKRMLGTMGNPNNNAILLLLFSFCYFPKKKWHIKEIIFFFLSIIAILACQSRTGIITFSVILLLNYLFVKIKWWKIISQLAGVALIAFLFFNINFDLNCHNQRRNGEGQKDYILSLVDGQAFNGNSWNKRLEIWEMLGTQIVEKPLIGHGPQKNYWYKEKLHAENEYIFFAWRYGLLGLLSYLLIYLIPLKKIFRTIRSSELSGKTLLLIVVFSLSALTNVPLSNTTLSLLFFCALGAFYSQKEDNHVSLSQNL